MTILACYPPSTIRTRKHISLKQIQLDTSDIEHGLDDPALYKGMPVGVMLMARPGREEKCLSIAMHIKEALHMRL